MNLFGAARSSGHGLGATAAVTSDAVQNVGDTMRWGYGVWDTHIFDTPRRLVWGAEDLLWGSGTWSDQEWNIDYTAPVWGEGRWGA